jgi:hypothetical protein
MAAKPYHWRNIPPVVHHLITTDGMANTTDGIENSDKSDLSMSEYPFV